MKDGERSKLEQIIGCIQNKSDVAIQHLSYEKALIERIRDERPEFFDLHNEFDELLPKTYDFILKHYNRAVESRLSVKSEFDLLRELASRKGVKFYSIFTEIGKNLESGKLPTIKQLYDTSNYVQTLSL
jgi:hypothetical protein